MDLNLKMLHIQLTRSCNLRCPFCGQDHREPENVLSKSEVFGILDQLQQYAPQAEVILWGGEVLLSKNFDEVAGYAKQAGFKLSIITNGTLIDRHVETLRSYFDKIYISVDGPEEIHDRVRGQGVFRKIQNNLKLLAGFDGEIISMSVCAPETLEHIHLVPFGLPVDRSILHEMIYISEDECSDYPGEATGVWQKNEVSGYQKNLAEIIEKLKTMKFPCPVEFQPHNSPVECAEPYRHLHISATGETCFCTDFTGKSLGNIREKSLPEIFEGEKAWNFRKNGNMPFCAHCAWRNTDETIIHFPYKKY